MSSKSDIRRTFNTFRKNLKPGRGDKYLPEVAQELRRILEKSEKQTIPNVTERLKPSELTDTAVYLTEMAEDLHNEIGLWNCLEEQQLKLYGKRIPWFSDQEDPLPPEAVLARRIRFFLWNLFRLFRPQVYLRFDDPSLGHMSEKASDYLQDRFAEIPKGSGLNTMLQPEVKTSRDLHQLLLWLGTQSYLIRPIFWHQFHLDTTQIKPEEIYLFLCGYPTLYSGMTVVDFAANLLNLNESDRKDLLEWNHRQVGVYQTEEIKKNEKGSHQIKMKNLINNRIYQVAGAPDEAITGFETNPILLSALVPWRGKWDLAGGLEPVNIKPPETLDSVRRDFIKNQPYYAYNVDRKLGERAQLATEALHLEFNTKFGDDLIAFPKVEEMLSEMRSFCETLLEKADPNDPDYPPVKEDPHRMNATLLPPICTGFPENIDSFQSDLAVFFNPKNGLELIPFYRDLISGMKKKGDGLTLEESETIQLMVESTSVSPEFIDRICKDHGPESIYTSYGISSDQGSDFLKFILKCSKGIHYRNQQTLLQPEFLFLGNKDSLMP